MAIAYYIPDQAQLLARSNQQHAQQPTTSSPARESRTTTAPAPAPAPTRPQRSQFRANVSVPLGSQQGSMSLSEFGCWELLAQIFCYALRICSYNSQRSRRPTVIQISFEISCPGVEENDDVTDATTKQD